MIDQSAKSLRWLANQFPAVETPRDDTDRMQTCIHLYCAAGADAIETLTDQLAALQSENAELTTVVKSYAVSARSIALWLRAYCDRSLPNDKMISDAAQKAASALSRMKAERDKLLDRAHEAQVERDCARAERDAAIADISHVCPTCGQFQGGDCPVLFYKDYPKDCEHWRWRGVQGEG